MFCFQAVSSLLSVASLTPSARLTSIGRTLGQYESGVTPALNAALTAFNFPCGNGGETASARAPLRSTNHMTVIEKPLYFFKTHFVFFRSPDAGSCLPNAPARRDPQSRRAARGWRPYRGYVPVHSSRCGSWGDASAAQYATAPSVPPDKTIKTSHVGDILIVCRLPQNSLKGAK